MRVALYHPWIYLRGGIERTLLELMSRSRHDWTLYTSHFRPQDTFPEFQDLPVVQVSKITVRRDLSSVARACARLLLSRVDWSCYDALMVSCDGIGNLLTLRAPGVPLLCLCHTPLKIAYDPETSLRWRGLTSPTLLTRAGVHAFKLIDRRLWHRYQRIFCVSSEVQDRLAGAGVSPEKMEVAHPGVDLDRLYPSGQCESFLLLPGRIMWTKNIELGIEAFFRFKSEPGAGDFRLVIAGMVDEKSRPYLAYLRRLAGVRNDVEFVLSPGDEELFDLYDRCHAVLFTPPNEDWGIVPLEAMAFAKPVVAVARGGPTESVADGATGFLCAPSPEEFAAALSRLSGDPASYERMSRAARERAALFTWSGFVSRIDDYIDSLAGRPARTEAAAR